MIVCVHVQTLNYFEVVTPNEPAFTVLREKRLKTAGFAKVLSFSKRIQADDRRSRIPDLPGSKPLI